ncbi:ABC transporter permease [soil metagenome]
MMLKNNFKMARDSLRSSRWRSFLTMSGVIIGIVSVVTVVSIGEGLKQQIQANITNRGPEVITILSGHQIERNDEGGISYYNPLQSVGFSLTEADLADVRDTVGVEEAVPFVRVSGVPMVNDDSMDNAMVIATDGDVPYALNQELRFGTFLDDEQTSGNRRFAVIGKRVAETLFNDPAPTGRSFEIGDQSFTVRGVFSEFESSALAFTSPDYNNVIFVSYEDNKRISSNGQHIYQILVKPSNPQHAFQTAQDIDTALAQSRDGFRDYSVIQQSETVSLYEGLLNALTTAIAAIAAISLFVGGIGIMNIMFVSVSERTGEIGVRKAIGATNGQILSQFMIEAIALSSIGGLLGVLASFLVNYLLRISTDLQPVILPQMMIIATAVAFLVGVIFGTVPAIRAARKDPIEALRSRL